MIVLGICLLFGGGFVAFGQDLVREPAPDYLCPEDDPHGTFEHETFCDKFYDCNSGDADLVTCEDGLGFDYTRRFHASKCDEFSNVKCGNRTEYQPAQPSPDGVCPRQNGRFTHPDPSECTSFVVCKQGKYVIKECSNGLHFDGVSGQCTWPDIAKRKGCEKKKKKAPDGWECPDPEDESTRDSSLGPANPNPTYPHPTDCAKFYICIGGTDPRPNTCPFGQVFDINDSTCVSPERVPECADWYDDDDDNDKREVAKKAPAPGPPRVKVRPTPTTRAPPVESAADRFKCPQLTLAETNGNPHPTFPHPSDCSKFYVCIELTEPRLNQCSAELVYNIDLEKCDEPALVPDCADWYTR